MSASMADWAWVAAGTALTIIIAAAVSLWIRQEVRGRNVAGQPHREANTTPQDAPEHGRQNNDKL